MGSLELRRLLGVWGVLVALLILRAVLNVASGYLVGGTGADMAAELRRRVYEHMQVLPLAWFQEHKQGEALSLLSSDAESISRFVTNTVVQLLPQLVTLAFAFPVGVLTAVYLEEFAPKNRWTDLIEVNINNLAAVPSIVFGLLGLAIFINFFGMPRSSPLVGGLTLGLMTLPVIIITTRSALRSVPDTIRQAAFGVGCSRWQVVRDHVLPLSLPGILTGSIIGLAQAMGETAPLIIVGMVAFIPDAPTAITQAATVLPAQIFTWAGEPEQAYVERTAAGILVLLSVLIFLNAAAVMLRKKFERKW